MEGSNIKELASFKQLTTFKGKAGKARYLWPEDQTGSWKWQYFKYFAPYQAYVCVTVYEKDLFAAITEIRNSIIISVLISIILFYLGISLLIKPITRTIDKSVLFAHELAQGNLLASIDINQKDELGKLANALRTMSSKLKEIVNSIQSGAGNIASASIQLSSGSQQLSQGANEQASSTEEVSTSMEEMLSNIEQNTDNAVNTQNIALAMNDSITESSLAAQSVIVAMNSIAGKIDIINDIAYQTNILALNAAVEAARAGDYGKGFAVVAAEVRKLAERSRVAAVEINELSRKGVEISRNAGIKLENAIPDIQKTAQLVQEIATSSMEQRSGVSQINTAIQQLNQTTQQNAAISEELATSAEELSSQAEQLKDAVAFFKLNETFKRTNKQTLKSASETLHNIPIIEEIPEITKDSATGVTVKLLEPGELIPESDYERY